VECVYRKRIASKGYPKKKKENDLDYYIELLDWELNTDPLFYEHRFMEPNQ